MKLWNKARHHRHTIMAVALAVYTILVWLDLYLDGTIINGRTYDQGMAYGALLVITVALIGAYTGLALSMSQKRRARRQPRSVDPDNPPHSVVFIRADGDPKTLCACHGEPIADGQEVVSWPSAPEFTCVDKGDDR